jgi:hypothetical protein
MRCCGPIDRRSFLEIGSLGFAGLTLSDMIQLQAVEPKPRKSLIFIWLPGGVSQLETYDLKPQAPDEYRGLLKPINTNINGIQISELFPKQSKIADKFTIIRSMSHSFTDHGGGSKRVMMARRPATPTGTINDHPSTCSMINRFTEKNNTSSIPNSIILGDSGATKPDSIALGAAYLGPQYTPFEVDGDPSKHNFKVNSLSLSMGLTSERLDNRMNLLKSIDKVDRSIDLTKSMSTMDKFHDQAQNLLFSSSVKAAFDVSLEKENIRLKYGQHAWGQRALMARRLIEAGCGSVIVTMSNPSVSIKPPTDNTYYNWDCHAVNTHLFDDMKFRAPLYDEAIAALIEDVYDRGLDKDVMIVVMGEFGHTPKLEYKSGKGGKIWPGRDHWSKAYSILVSGGGFKMGQVIGKSDDKGAFVEDRMILPEDLWTTIFYHMNINPKSIIHDFTGRPIPLLPEGNLIKELI